MFWSITENLFQGFNVNQGIRATKAALLGENKQTSRVHQISVLSLGLGTLSSSPLITNPLMKGAFSVISTGLYINWAVEIGHHAKILNLEAPGLKEIHWLVDQAIEKLFSVTPAVLITHALALCVFQHSLIPFSFVAMYGLVSLHHNRYFGEKFQGILETAFPYLEHVSGLAHPHFLYKVASALSLTAQAYQFFAPEQKISIEKPLTMNEMRGKLDVVTAKNALFDDVPLCISEDHYQIDPSPQIDRTKKIHLSEDFSTAFSTPESSERLCTRAKEHKDWWLWSKAHPNGSEKQFGQEMLDTLLHEIETESLPHGPTVSYRYLQNKLALINLKIESLCEEERENTLLKLTFDSGNHCSEAASAHVPQIADDLFMTSEGGNLLPKVLTILQDFRYKIAVNYGTEFTESNFLLRLVFAVLYGDKGDMHRTNAILKSFFLHFGLPERGFNEDVTLENAPISDMICSSSMRNALAKSPRVYSPSVIIDWLEQYFKHFRTELFAWAATSGPITDVYMQIEHTSIDDENFERDFYIWIDDQFKFEETRIRFLTAYLIDVGVFTLKN